MCIYLFVVFLFIFILSIYDTCRYYVLFFLYRYVERSQQKKVQTQATVAEHYGLAPSARGYRFGNHPMTRGPVRFGGSG